MKTLQEVVKMRKSLQADLSSFEINRAELLRGRRFTELDDFEKRDHMYIVGVISKLKVQIDALTYVINYDSTLDDVTVRPMMRHT